MFNLNGIQTILRKLSAKVYLAHCRTSFQNFGSFPVCGSFEFEGLTVTSHLAMQIQNKTVKIFITESNVVKLAMEERKIIDKFVNRPSKSTIRLSSPER